MPTYMTSVTLTSPLSPPPQTAAHINFIVSIAKIHHWITALEKFTPFLPFALPHCIERHLQMQWSSCLVLDIIVCVSGCEDSRNTKAFGKCYLGFPPLSDLTPWHSSRAKQNQHAVGFSRFSLSRKRSSRAQTKLSRKSEASACVQSFKVIFKRWKSIHAISAHPLILLVTAKDYISLLNLIQNGQ